MTLHEIPLERRTLHGHFSRELEPVLTIDSGDSIVFSAPDAGWGIGPFDEDGMRQRFEPRDPELDRGHPLIGPVAVRGARAGQTLEVRIEEVRVGTWGVTDAGGWSTPLNERLGVADGETATVIWDLDADVGVGRDRAGREVTLAPFLGVIGMPPDEPGIHSTAPPRACGGNIDCKELVAGHDALPPDPGRRRAPLRGGRACGAGRRRGLAARDRGAGRARAADAPRARRPRRWRGRSPGRARRG